MSIYLHRLPWATNCNTMTVMEHEAWVDALIGDDTRRTASAKAGMSESTLSRQLARNALSPEMVIALCRTYDRSPIDGLVETGYLAEYEVDGSVASVLRQAKNSELLDEVMRRSDPDALYLFGRTEDVINPSPDAEVFDFPTPNVTPLGDDEMPESAVAYSGPDEDALRQEDDVD